MTLFSVLTHRRCLVCDRRWAGDHREPCPWCALKAIREAETAECIYCQAILPIDSLEHWKDCEKHPARAEVLALRSRDAVHKRRIQELMRQIQELERLRRGTAW